jgi:predicted RNase H-like nuclease (RuvC/YqgF family)
MECSICYQQIIDHKLFKAGCCSFNACVDCIREGKINKCPQCQKSYNWINRDHESIKKLNSKIRVMNETLEYYMDILEIKKDQIKDLEASIEELKKESMIKSKYMEQMSNTIVYLVEEKEEEEENKADLEDVIQRYHLNLI